MKYLSLLRCLTLGIALSFGVRSAAAQGLPIGAIKAAAEVARACGGDGDSGLGIGIYVNVVTQALLTGDNDRACSCRFELLWFAAELPKLSNRCAEAVLAFVGELSDRCDKKKFNYRACNLTLQVSQKAIFEFLPELAEATELLEDDLTLAE